jgi:hypothetical protein
MEPMPPPMIDVIAVGTDGGRASISMRDGGSRTMS